MGSLGHLVFVDCEARVGRRSTVIAVAAGVVAAGEVLMRVLAARVLAAVELCERAE